MRRPIKQHIVSRVILERFTQNSMCSVFDLERKEQRPPASVGSIGFIKDYIPQSSGKYEAKWGEIEGKLPALFRALDSKEFFKNDYFSKTAKECMALHFIRCGVIRLIYQQHINGLEEKETQRLLNEREETLQQLFLYSFGRSPKDENERIKFAKAIAVKIKNSLDGYRYLGEIVDEYVKKIVSDLEGAHLHVGEAIEGSFLVGDSPALTLDNTTGKLGVLQGVAFKQANGFFMPFGPRHIIAVASARDTKNEWVELDAVRVAEVNKKQVLGALREIYYRPQDDFADFASNIR